MQIKSANEAEKVNPNLKDVYYWRAVAYRETGKLHEALTDFRKVLEVKDNSAKDFDKLVIALRVSSLPMFWITLQGVRGLIIQSWQADGWIHNQLLLQRQIL